MRVMVLFCLMFLSIINAPFALGNGPIEVSINLIETEVSLSEDLQFEISITNTAENNSYIDVSYWVDNGTAYGTSSSVFVPAGSRIILGKGFSIFYNERAGEHTLNVRVENSTIISPITVKKTFLVIGKDETNGSSGTVTTIPKKKTGLKIISYPEEIEIEKGWSKYVDIIIKNTGEKTMYNIELSVEGIAPEWLEIQPEKTGSVIANRNETISVIITVPKETDSKNYLISFKASSEADEIVDEVDAMLRVFASEKELVLLNLDTVRERLVEIEYMAISAEKEGKNVTKVIDAIDEIKDRLRIVEKYMETKDYVIVLDMVKESKNLLVIAEGELERAPLIQIEKDVFEIGYWQFVIVISLVVIILIYWRKRGVKISGIVRHSILEAKGTLLGRISNAELEKERERIKKMLKIIEREYREGIISKRSYEELKNKNEKRLSEISGKMGWK